MTSLQFGVQTRRRFVFDAVPRIRMERALGRLVVTVMEIIIASIFWNAFQHSHLKLDVASVPGIVRDSGMPAAEEHSPERSVIRIYR